ncbi:MAG TPA: proline dehydrogenase family protein [Solirubrobacterales bacterium]|nr:proline dehydrogenase family protein [Solirubrobacterales bacterium]
MESAMQDERIPAPSEAAVRSIGEGLIEALEDQPRSARRALEERAMAQLAEEPATRAALFRVVDVAPSCRSAGELSRHISALLDEVPEPPPVFRLGGKLASQPVTRAAVGLSAAAAVRAMARRFIAGEDVDSAARELDRLWRRGIANTVDLLGEATVTDAEADAYAGRCLEAIEALAERSLAWAPGAREEADRHGPIPRANLSIKVSALTARARPEAPWRGVEDAAPRLRALLRRARELGAHLHVDMESLDLRETVVELVRTVLAEPEFDDGPAAGVVVQAYLRDSPEEVEGWLAWATERRRDAPFQVRLVKGAYWDHERVEAAQHGWPVPVFEDRASCDRNFEALTRRLLASADLVRPAIATHNLRSVAHAAAAARDAGAEDVLELQVLRGLGDDLSAALSARGYRVRAYCPIGDLVAGMAYLVRRLLENTSNDSFLHASAVADDLTTLLARP